MRLWSSLSMLLKLTREQPDKFRVLSDLMDYPLMWAVDATYVNNMKQNRPMVYAWVKTCIQAKRAFIKDRDLAVSAYMDDVPTANKDDLGKVWDFYVKKKVWDPNGGLNPRLVQLYHGRLRGRRRSQAEGRVGQVHGYYRRGRRTQRARPRLESRTSSVLTI